MLVLQPALLHSKERLIQVASPQVVELSGLATSKADPTIMWAHNDSNNDAVLYRVGLNGEDLGAIPVEGAESVDWEDIASFTWKGRPALLVGDVGDNNAMRDHVTLYAFSDPGRAGIPQLLWKQEFRYPEGARDCESVAVDPTDDSILLLTKREIPPVLYRIRMPSHEGNQDPVHAEKLGPVTTIPRATRRDRLFFPLQSAHFGRPTGMDISADGRTAVVVSYRESYRIDRSEGQGWVDAFAAGATPLGVPFMVQSEAIAISADGLTAVVSSEGIGAPLERVSLRGTATVPSP